MLNIQDFNPDCMTKEELAVWSDAVGLGRRPAIAKQWFPGVKGQSKLARYVKYYCNNKSAAISLRLRGNIESALQHERICDAIYQDLKPHCNW